MSAIATSRRPKLSIEKQIDHMKRKGIKFDLVNEEKAIKYLSNHTYYFKIKAYEKLFDRYNIPEKENKFVDLEFAYLCDLATIDCYLRKEILSISLDIEHYLKVKLLNDFNNSEEDGYSIVSDFINTNPDHYEKEIENKMEGKVCSNLVKKYRSEWAIWNFIEVLSFGDFAQFYQFFYSRNDKFDKSKRTGYFINPVRVLRNAAAHNNCLLQTLKNPYVTGKSFNQNYTVNAFLGRSGIKSRTLNKNMSRPLVHDLCVMLYLYHCITPMAVQKFTFERLELMFEKRFALHKEYYECTGLLISSYNFVLSVIKVFLNIVQNVN